MGVWRGVGWTFVAPDEVLALVFVQHLLLHSSLLPFGPGNP
jgi:D-alanyl-lipoteichoic acid acyltransferase DltB (MBOAT superfamily)